MKKLLLSLAILAACAGSASAFPKAIYVKQGNSFTKFNLGAAGNLNFSDNGNKLTVTGYGEVVDLNNIDYITFSAPIDETALSPAEQKEKFLNIGEAFLSNIDLNSNAELIKMAYRFFEYDDDYDTFAEYEWPKEFWDVHNEFRAAMKSFNSLANGNPAAVRGLRAAAVNLYKLNDYFGVYTANTNNKTWEKTSDADYFEMRYPAPDSDTFKVRLEAGSDCDIWNTPDANIQLAKDITISFIKGNTVLSTAKMISNLAQDQSISMDITVETGSYTATSDLDILNSGITDVVKVSYNGKYLCRIDTKVDGKNLLVYDEMFDAIKETTHYHDAEDNCCGDDPTQLLSHIFRGTTNVDILSQLQAKGIVFNLNKLYDVMSEEEDDDDYYYFDGRGIVYNQGKVVSWEPETGELQYSYSDSGYAEKVVKYLNNYADASFYYDNDNKMQGYLSFENFVEKEDSWIPTDDDYFQYGYVILDNHIIEVVRESIRDEYGNLTGNFGSWYYYGYDESNDESYQVTVKDEDVIHPTSRTELYYELTPILVFPDLTSFAFDEYFSESAFKPLVNDYDDIIDTYLSITGQDKDDNDDWY